MSITPSVPVFVGSEEVASSTNRFDIEHGVERGDVGQPVFVRKTGSFSSAAGVRGSLSDSEELSLGDDVLVTTAAIERWDSWQESLSPPLSGPGSDEAVESVRFLRITVRGCGFLLNSRMNPSSSAILFLSNRASS